MSTAPVGVRRADADDRDQVWPLARDLATSYEVDASVYAGTFGRLITTPDVVLLVAEVDEKVVGYLLGQLHHTFHANGPVGWLEELMVAADHRGRGVGRALLDAGTLWARSQGATYLALATRRAADFYLRQGFLDSAAYLKRPL